MFVRVGEFISLTCTALLLGLTSSHVLQSPGSRELDGPAWLEVQHSFYGGFAVLGGICEIVGLIATATLAIVYLVGRRFGSALAPLIAALALLGALFSYFFGNRPVNLEVSGWTATTLPADWSSYRDSWENAHAISAGLAAIAFIALAIAIVWQHEHREQ